MPQQSNAELLEMTTDIVASFVANNPVPTSALPDLIQTVHETVLELASDEPAAPLAQTLQSRFRNRSRRITSSALKMVGS